MAHAINTNKALSVSPGIDSAMPLSLTVWFRPLESPNQDKVWPLWYIQKGSDTGAVYRYWNTIRAAYKNYAVEAATGGSQALNTWRPATGVFPSTASRTIYGTAGSNTNSTAVTAMTGDIVESFIGWDGTWFANDHLCELAAWSAELTADEVTSLNKGFPPKRVRPQSLMCYIPLVRDINDIRGGRTVTDYFSNIGAAVAHTRRYG